MLNYSQALNALREELIAFKIGLHNFGYILDDALSSLTRWLILAALILPKVLQKVLPWWVETGQDAGSHTSIRADDLLRIWASGFYGDNDQRN